MVGFHRGSHTKTSTTWSIQAFHQKRRRSVIKKQESQWDRKTEDHSRQTLYLEVNNHL